MKVIQKRQNGSTQVLSVPEGESLAQQQYKDQCDVNKIIAKYKATGTLTHVRNAQQGVYADLTEITDYHDALNKIHRANTAFSELPAQLRLKLNNNPENLINYLLNPENDQEAVKLGLKTPKASEPAAPAEPETPPTT